MQSLLLPAAQIKVALPSFSASPLAATKLERLCLPSECRLSPRERASSQTSRCCSSSSLWPSPFVAPKNGASSSSPWPLPFRPFQNQTSQNTAIGVDASYDSFHYLEEHMMCDDAKKDFKCQKEQGDDPVMFDADVSEKRKGLVSKRKNIEAIVENGNVDKSVEETFMQKSTNKQFNGSVEVAKGLKNILSHFESVGSSGYIWQLSFTVVASMGMGEYLGFSEKVPYFANAVFFQSSNFISLLWYLSPMFQEFEDLPWPSLKNFEMVVRTGLLYLTMVCVYILFTTVVTEKVTLPVSVYLNIVGIAAAMVSVFHWFQYIEFAGKFQKRPSKAPPRAHVVQTIKKGMLINVLGLGAAILGVACSPVLSLKVYLVQAGVVTIISHFLGLVLSLELLRLLPVITPPQESSSS